jgi:hypothetical protein
MILPLLSLASMLTALYYAVKAKRLSNRYEREIKRYQ